MSCLSFVQDRVPGEPFVAKPSKDAEMDKIMRSMQVSSDDFKAYAWNES